MTAPSQNLPGNTAGLQAVRSKADRLSEALEKGLRIPWRGLRPDLVLHKGAPRMGGRETYVLEDPVRGTHYELGEAEARFFMCLVTEQTLHAAVDRLLRTTALRPSVDDILTFVQMLQREKLAVLPAEAADASAEAREQRKPSAVRKVLTGYLFFKIPLLRPQGVLDAIYPWLSPLWSRPCVFIYAVVGVGGRHVGDVFEVREPSHTKRVVYFAIAVRVYDRTMEKVVARCRGDAVVVVLLLTVVHKPEAQGRVYADVVIASIPEIRVDKEADVGAVKRGLSLVP